MADLPTIAQTINIGKATTFLMSNDFSKGSLFGARLLKQSSSVLIAYVTQALGWQYSSLPADETLRGTANYLLWLCGIYRLEASSYTGGGSAVMPVNPNQPFRYPFYIFSSDFESDGVSYNNQNIVGDNIMIFINEFSQQWLVAGAGYFSYTDQGIIITIPGFDSNIQEYTIIIQQVFGSGVTPTPTPTGNDLLINETDSLLINSTDSLLIS